MTLNDPLPLKKHGGRNDLVGEHPQGDSLQVVIILVFLAVWITDTFIWQYSTFLTGYVPVYARLVAGTAVAVPALILIYRAHKMIFGTERAEPVVLRTGVFSVVRHPLYLGSILSVLSMVLYSLSLASAGIWIVIVVFYAYICRYEEKALLLHFGEEYRQYQEEVPMLLPWIGTR